MNKIFIDCDIILDLLTTRKPHYRHAAQLFSLIETGKIKGYVSPLVFANVHYVLRKFGSNHKAIISLNKLNMLVDIIPIDKKVINLALTSTFKDFEDAIQYYTALQHDISHLITRNKKDYKDSNLIICTAEEFLKIWYATS